ncbi:MULTISPECIES: DUF515 domain-containing protein [Methanothermobacter]|uniref:Flp pilus assembly protein RcpC/CpaB domain-containing protein n=1 Tax=Methanothermobacter marburgensis (strain ATCC BAA-927 / DSM 2133 / JCM 14651 / NBRC 100331 / OCM 82 / Marburg) TaxID=79929 RepID=D9PXP9_METTM|nr:MULTISPECIES: DUF515 domain-containing protein [Methanothermobacter]ADL58997.1 conserved hypothetical protein [Methanothermobacter marburgensis str. Marburg]QEF94822.1 DUF515 domain-containing protein [Methanothermobacter sp. KEPCO-1]QHN07956.1 DUF515 domain-containing protein [Methanothermobacter sp. THM-2]WBF09532.1 DUF515 domain-containing protein [Methanothermobacter marburgensis]
MLDKIKGNEKGNKNNPPDLRKNNRKGDSKIGDKLKGLVGKFGGGEGSDKKKPRPMPKPRPRLKTPEEPKARKAPEKPLRGGEQPKPRLTPPPKRPGGPSGGIGRKIPDEDQKTLVGALVFGVILMVLAGAGYYFLVYQPYQEVLQNAKATKIAEVDALFKGPLATDPQKQAILAQIDAAVTPEEALAVDVVGPATQSWRTYQNQQINIKKDRVGRVMVNYTDNDQQKRVIMKVADAKKFVSQADATVLANTQIQTPDTVAVPIMITRLQAAGGLISVGNMVDVYLNQNATENNTSAAASTPRISGATVLAILRSKDSGTVDARILNTQRLTLNTITSQSENERTSSTDVEQLLRAAASGGLNEAEINAILQNYGIRLSNYERSSNLGELDANYLIILEVPREDVLFLIQNMNSIVLTVPTQNAPDWMIRELQSIYG